MVESVGNNLGIAGTIRAVVPCFTLYTTCSGNIFLACLCKSVCIKRYLVCMVATCQNGNVKLRLGGGIVSTVKCIGVVKFNRKICAALCTIQVRKASFYLPVLRTGCSASNVSTMLIKPCLPPQTCRSTRPPDTPPGQSDSTTGCP